MDNKHIGEKRENEKANQIPTRHILYTTLLRENPERFEKHDGNNSYLIKSNEDARKEWLQHQRDRRRASTPSKKPARASKSGEREKADERVGLVER